MRILITAGGTQEPIDDVRAITNHSTGSLGQAVAAAFLEQPDWVIDYVTTKQAQQPPANPRLTCHWIQSTQDLADKLTALLDHQPYTAVIHSMAVSDYTTEAILTEETFIHRLTTELPEINQAQLQQFFQRLSAEGRPEGKVSSEAERQLLTLKKTPKVIQMIKTLQPATLLVGFKLLVNVTSEELLTVANAALVKNQADYILANDLAEISGQQHHGYLVAKNGQISEAYTKAEIAQLLTETIRRSAK